MSPLFGTVWIYSGPDWVIKRFFDDMYDDGRFIEVVSYLSRRWGYVNDDVACHFPDMNSYFEEEHFEGVQFILCLPTPDPYEVIVSDEEFAVWLRMACDRYLAQHPSDVGEISKSLAQLDEWSSRS